MSMSLSEGLPLSLTIVSDKSYELCLWTWVVTQQKNWGSHQAFGHILNLYVHIFFIYQKRENHHFKHT